MQPDAAPQPELLAGQSKANIGILLANNRRNVISEGFWSAVVADLNILAPPVKVASCMTRPLIANCSKNEFVHKRRERQLPQAHRERRCGDVSNAEHSSFCRFVYPRR
jgi:hypothetical protein